MQNSGGLHFYNCHPLATPRNIVWPTFSNSKKKGMCHFPPCQHGYISFHCPCTPCCPNCCCSSLIRATKAQHNQELERIRAEQEKLRKGEEKLRQEEERAKKEKERLMKEKERFRQGEEARLGRRASEIARLEQELQQKRAQLLHEQKLYEENKKGWLKN